MQYLRHCSKFRHYLIGHKFIIPTDQESLKSLDDQFLSWKLGRLL